MTWTKRFGRGSGPSQPLPKKPFDHRRRLLAAAFLFLLALGGLALALRRQKPALSPPSSLLTSAAQGLDEIHMEATLLPDSRQLAVSQTLALVSRTAEARDTLVLRAYPNAFQSADTSPCALEADYDLCYPEGFSAGALVMEAALAQLGDGDEAAVAYRYTDAAKTVLSLPLPAAWIPGQRLTVRLRYTVTLPRAAYRFGVSGGTFALGNAFLTPAPWKDGGYQAEEYAPLGDPFPGEPANYTLSLTAPQGYLCAASAWAEGTENGHGQRVWYFTAPALRDFALAAGEGWRLTQAKEGSILVSAYAADSQAASEALGYARKALRVYGERYGAYPYTSLALAECDLALEGTAYPGLVMLPSRLLQAGGEALELAVARLVARQWWGATVGNDPVNQPWQHEALCEYSLLDYLEAAHGKAARENYYETAIAPSLRVTLPRGVTPGAPLSYFSSRAQYVLLARQRGAALLWALDQMTEGGMDGMLRAYYGRYAFQTASREDFTRLLGQVTGMDCQPLMIDYLDTYVVP